MRKEELSAVLQISVQRCAIGSSEDSLTRSSRGHPPSEQSWHTQATYAVESWSFEKALAITTTPPLLSRSPSIGFTKCKQSNCGILWRDTSYQWLRPTRADFKLEQSRNTARQSSKQHWRVRTPDSAIEPIGWVPTGRVEPGEKRQWRV